MPRRRIDPAAGRPALGLAAAAALATLAASATGPLVAPVHAADTLAGGEIAFLPGVVEGLGATAPTCLAFGPDGRLYVTEREGRIRAFQLVRHGPADYGVVAEEIIDLVRTMPNRDDQGRPFPLAGRLVTGLIVEGSAPQPVLWVTSSDPRWASGLDENLDTNSGIVSRLVRQPGGAWIREDVIRGLPRSEENHGPNAMALDAATNTLFVAVGGHTNMGAPATIMGELPEYALSAAILAIDLGAIDALGPLPYDLPTLDDPTRPNVAPGVDEGDPFGGNDGLNQAVLLPDGPVTLHATGLRNPYDLVLDDDGTIWTSDNGANAGWGSPPAACTNDLAPPGSGITAPDALYRLDGPDGHFGHPNPTRASTANTFGGASPVPQSNPIECDWIPPGPATGALALFDSSVNGLVRYRAGDPASPLFGDLLAASWNDASIYRIDLAADGRTVLGWSPLVTPPNAGVRPLDLTVQTDAEAWPGTIWIADYGANTVRVLEPADFSGCTGADDPDLDEDGDGYANDLELAAGSDPCSPASVPADFDLDGLPDLLDDDDDDDGLADLVDPFALDPANGLFTVAPLRLDWVAGAPGTGLFGAGFTGLMLDGDLPWHDLFDPSGITAGGAAGRITIDAVAAGDAVGPANELRDGLLLGVRIADADAGRPFVVRTIVDGPGPAAGGASQGVFFGTGTQSDFVRIALAGGPGGAGGSVAFTVEANDAPLVQSVAGPGPDAAAVELALRVDPDLGTVSASWRERFADGSLGRETPVGGALPLPPAVAALLPADRPGPASALALGLAAAGGAAPGWTASWSELALSIEGADEPLVQVLVDPPGFPIEGSCSSAGSFQIVHLGAPGPDAPRIASVRIDLSTALLPDLVFDPDGVAGDDVTVPFLPGDGLAATGFVDHAFEAPRDGGYDAIRLDFFAFDPGEIATFAADVDPTTTRGTPAPGPGGSGEVSGLELAGATVTATLSDGTELVGRLVRRGTSLDGAEVRLAASGPPAPILELPGLRTESIAGGLGAEVAASGGGGAGAGQALVRITGAPGAAARLLVLDAGLFEPAGGRAFDVDPYEANRVLAIEQVDLVLPPSGVAELFVPVPATADETSGLFHLFLWTSDGAGRTAVAADRVVLRGVPTPLVAEPALPAFPPTPAGETASLSVTITNAGGTVVPGLAATLSGDAAFSFASPPPDGVLLDPGASVVLDLAYAPGGPGADAAQIDLLVAGQPALALSVTGSGAVADGTILHRINAGGPAVPAIDGGPDWTADTAAAPSPFVNASGTLVAAAALPLVPGPDFAPHLPPALLQHERFDPAGPPPMRWDLPAAGTATVELVLAFGESFVGANDPGERVFDVVAEGETILDDLDQSLEAGYLVGFTRRFLVAVNDGVLDLDFVRAIENPTIKGIEVVAGPANDDCLAAATLADGAAAAFTLARSRPSAVPVPADCGATGDEADRWWRIAGEPGAIAAVGLAEAGGPLTLVLLEDGCPGLPEQVLACGADAVETAFPANGRLLVRVLGPAEASGTISLEIRTGGPACPADLDGDGAVGFLDLLAMLEAWGGSGKAPGGGDLDGDGTVGFADLVALLEAWGPCGG